MGVGSHAIATTTDIR